MTRAEYLLWRDSIAISPVAFDSILELKDGRRIAVRHQPMPDGGWVAPHDDITERKHVEESLRRSNEQLQQVALHDPLTGLANRRKFVERFASQTSKRFYALLRHRCRIEREPTRMNR